MAPFVGAAPMIQSYTTYTRIDNVSQGFSACRGIQEFGRELGLTNVAINSNVRGWAERCRRRPFVLAKA